MALASGMVATEQNFEDSYLFKFKPQKSSLVDIKELETYKH